MEQQWQIQEIEKAYLMRNTLAELGALATTRIAFALVLSLALFLLSSAPRTNAQEAPAETPTEQSAIL